MRFVSRPLWGKYLWEETFGVAPIGLYGNTLTRDILTLLSFDERLQKLTEVMEWVAAPQSARLPDVRGMVNVTIANLQTVYLPKNVAPLPFHYFAGGDLEEKDIQWRKATWSQSGPMEFHMLRGGHKSLITDAQYVLDTAHKIAACFQRRSEQYTERETI